MHDHPGTVETIGREQELALARGFVRGESPDRLLLVEGSAGVGKTTVWSAALAGTSGAPLRVLQARAAEAETGMAYAVLNDLLAGLDLAGIDLPRPQRQALDVALLRSDDMDTLAPHAVALGVTQVLRDLAAQAPVLLAIDDLQWVDQPTAEALAFALRRTPAEGVRLLGSRRTGPPTPIEEAVPREQRRVIALDGLSVGAVRRLLLAHLGIELPRRALLQVHDVTLGNPLYVLEIGRVLASRGIPAIGRTLEVPRSLDELLATKVTAAPDARRALLTVALGGALSPVEVRKVVPAASLDAALDAGLLVEDAGRIRPGHPLYAAAVIGRAREGELRDVHERLAQIASDPIRRARHLAAASANPDGALARSIEGGASVALARGLIHVAVELSEAALRLTPPADPARDGRVVTLGERLLRADERPRLRELLAAELGNLPAGNLRAAAHLLATHATNNQADFDGHLEATLRETTDPELRARALAAQAIDDSNALLQEYDRAERRAAEAMAISPGGISLYEAVHGMAWARIMRGKPIDDLRARLGGDDHPDFAYSLARVEAIQRLFRGEVDFARAYFREQRDRAIELGQENARNYTQHQMCETELRGGDLAAAAMLLEEKDPNETMGSMHGHSARLHALVAAMRGDSAGADLLAKRAIDLGQDLQNWDLLEAWRARGVGALSVDDPGRARDELLRVWSFTEERGIQDPGAFPVSADLVEAAHALGDMTLATDVLDRLRTLSVAQAHPWGLASVARCEGLELAASGVDAAAADRFATAVAGYDALGCRFDAARTLLAQGRAARRARKWGVARGALEDAAARFDALSCTGWAGQARRLLDGLGGRRPTVDGALTPSEHRVAVLAAEGRSNKDIAASLYVGVHTVEVHLARAYAKLGVQSRTQLGRALASAGPSRGDAAPIN